jgi:serine O-acetyltransferase
VRTVFYERLYQGTPSERRLVKLLRRTWRGLPSVELSCPKIGGGFVLAHGYSTVVRAESIGRDCRIFQQVTVGAIHGEYPTIGDRVTIYPGAKVLGGITIGPDAVIGPNALVQQDVPPGRVMVAPRAEALTLADPS